MIEKYSNVRWPIEEPGECFHVYTLSDFRGTSEAGSFAEERCKARRKQADEEPDECLADAVVTENVSRPEIVIVH